MSRISRWVAAVIVTPAVVMMMVQTSSPAQSPASTPRPPDYRIHAGDQLNVQTYGEQGLSLVVTVSHDGSVVLPLVGRVALATLTTDQAAASIRSAARRYVRDPIVTVGVISEGQLDVLVLGNVKTPGKYKLRADARVSDAIAAAGGIGATDGPYPNARVADAAGGVKDVDLQALLRAGDLTVNIPLADGGAVYVQGPTSFQVDVLGAVDHPGAIEVSEGDRLSVAIAKAGTSANSSADLNNILVRRVTDKGSTQSFQVDLYKILNGQASNDLVLRKGDVVMVPKAHKGAAGFDPTALIRRYIGFPL